jgi:NhaP-type Na+/H+ or K+/H+ antiporter
VLALALLAYGGSILVHGNGFVAAFAAGVAFGHVAGRGGPREVFYVEQTAGLASLLVWTLFGAVAVPVLLDGNLGWAVIIYAVLSLTVIRMAPVAACLAGTGLAWRTVLFVGWFGPRGLASVIFALMALEELGAPARPAAAVIFLTVLLSVVAHGLTASPLAVRYGRRAAPADASGTEPAGATGTEEPSPATRWGAARVADVEAGAPAHRDHLGGDDPPDG